MEIHRRVVPGSSRAMLDCLHTNLEADRPSILIALPFGVPADIALVAFELFGRDFNLASWESRYILKLDQAFSGQEAMGPDEHVNDMACIATSLGFAGCNLIGYCSGAGISLLAATRRPDLFSRLILVNGEFQLFRRGHPATAYQKSIDAFLPLAAKGRQEAAIFFARMSELSRMSKPGEQTDLEASFNKPFSQAEYLFRYARNYMAYREFDALSIARDVRQATLVLTGGSDEHAGMENSLSVADSVPGARTFVHEGGDHYEFCRRDSSTLEAIRSYLEERAAS